MEYYYTKHSDDISGAQKQQKILISSDETVDVFKPITINKTEVFELTRSFFCRLTLTKLIF